MKTSFPQINKSKKNYRITKQRKVILEELRKVCTHPTAKDLYLLVQKVDPTINLATIYRTLDFLEKQELILRLKTKSKEARYDGNFKKHCHLICQKCGHVEDIFDCVDVSVKSKQLKKSGFKVSFDLLELHGFCKNCHS